jgi:hypothetical protein
MMYVLLINNPHMLIVFDYVLGFGMKNIFNVFYIVIN